MTWGSASEFFSMGGYGVYVWGSYGITAGLIGFESWLALRRRQRALRDALAAASAPASDGAQR
jgi:heme exporter protein D